MKDFLTWSILMHAHSHFLFNCVRADRSSSGILWAHWWHLLREIMKAINWWAHKARRMWGNLRLTVNSWPGIDGLSVDSSISCTPSIGQEITLRSASSISCRRIPILWAGHKGLSYKPTVVDWNSRDRKCIPHRLILSLKHKLSLTVETRTPSTDGRLQAKFSLMIHG